MSKRYYLVSLGCPKNTVDSEGIAHLLHEQGYVGTENPAQADLLIVNTCAFIASAQAESVETLQQLAQSKRPGQVLIAAGCFPERPEMHLATLVPQLDGMIGARHWSEFPAFLAELTQRKASMAQAGPCYAWPLDASTPNVVPAFDRQALGGSAYIKIADGCDARCAYCAIPLIKGPQQSKPLDAIVYEARQLVEQGTKELVLVAQDTTAYGRDLGLDDGLPILLDRLVEVMPADTWLRIMYAYPQHLTPRLIEIMAAAPQICHYIDIPLQHSHPDVLRRMRRSADTDGVHTLLAQLRQAMPDIALRTTFIVGYPGETEAEFEHLMDFITEMQFDKMGVFTYSREAGTLAATLPDQVQPEVMQERLDMAMSVQQGISMARNRTQIGRTLDVLIEGADDGLSVGRSYRDAPEIDGLVFVEGEWPSGEFLSVHITEAMEYDLVGEALTSPRRRARSRRR